MMWRLFRGRKPALDPDLELWWRDADAVAMRPTGAGVTDLRPRLAADESERERQEEMLDGLDALCQSAHTPLPQLDTQHRVIGQDACHFMAPASAPDHGDAIGKLFLTSHRVIFAGGASITWPWHRVRRISRHDRELLFEGGETLALRLRCNSYADALVGLSIAERVRETHKR